MCVVHYSLIFQTFSHSIIMWTSYPWFIVWLNLIYTSYCFTILRCNVVPLSFTFDIFFLDEVGHENFVSLVISICHNCFGIIFIQTIRLLLIIIQKFIHVPHSSKYFMFFVTIIHVHVVFIQHNCFGINFIHTFQHDKYFIQTNCLHAIIIQKVHWRSIFIQSSFFDFHPCSCGKLFSTSFLCYIRIF